MKTYRFPYSVIDHNYGDFDDSVLVDLDSFSTVDSVRDKVIDAIAADMVENWEPEFIDMFWKEGFSDEDSARNFLSQVALTIHEPEVVS